MDEENTYRPEFSGQRKYSGRDEGIRFDPASGTGRYFHISVDRGQSAARETDGTEFSPTEIFTRYPWTAVKMTSAEAEVCIRALAEADRDWPREHGWAQSQREEPDRG